MECPQRWSRATLGGGSAGLPTRFAQLLKHSSQTHIRSQTLELMFDRVFQHPILKPLSPTPPLFLLRGGKRQLSGIHFILAQGKERCLGEQQGSCMKTTRSVPGIFCTIFFAPLRCRITFCLWGQCVNMYVMLIKVD